MSVSGNILRIVAQPPLNSSVSRLSKSVLDHLMPIAFRGFDCAEYFSSSTFRRGVVDPESQLQLIYSESQLRVIKAADFLAVGSAGADGIEFGFRKGISGLWAFHPNEGRFQAVASSLQSLVAGFRDGSIRV